MMTPIQGQEDCSEEAILTTSESRTPAEESISIVEKSTLKCHPSYGANNKLVSREEAAVAAQEMRRVMLGQTNNPLHPQSVSLVTNDRAEKTPFINEPASYGANNKMFTRERAEVAARVIRKKLGQINIGFDPELILADLEFGGYHVEAGERSFAACSAKMIGQFGEAVRPYLKQTYFSVRHQPEFDAAGMDSYASVDAQIASNAAERHELRLANNNVFFDKEFFDKEFFDSFYLHYSAAEAADYLLIGASIIAKGITIFADWVAAMKKSVPDLPDDLMQEIYDESKALVDSEMLGVDAKEDIAAAEKQKNYLKKIPVIKKIAAKAAEGQDICCAAVYALVKEKLVQGIEGLKAITASTADIKQFYPMITEREVRDMFTAYGEAKFSPQKAS
jgi:hypothetical protein